MIYLTLDTNTWIYLANGHEPRKFFLEIMRYVENLQIRIVLPEIVLQEWHRNKTSKVQAYAVKEYKNAITNLNKVSQLLVYEEGGSLDGEEVFGENKKPSFKSVVKHLKSLTHQIEARTNSNIELIDKLFESYSVIHEGIHEEDKNWAIELGLSRKAPMTSKNNIADCLIAAAVGRFARKISDGDCVYFLSYNVGDFMDTHTNSLHQSIQIVWKDTPIIFLSRISEFLEKLKKHLQEEYQELHLYNKQIEELELDTTGKSFECEHCSTESYRPELSYTKSELIDKRKPQIYNPNQLEFDYAKGLVQPPKRIESILTAECDFCGAFYFICPECEEEVIYSEGISLEFECEHCTAQYELVSMHGVKEEKPISGYFIVENKVCKNCGDVVGSDFGEYCWKCILYI